MVGGLVEHPGECLWRSGSALVVFVVLEPVKVLRRGLSETVANVPRYVRTGYQARPVNE
jgi:hypothetical protein